LKIILVGTEPEIDPRIRKIKASLKKYGYQAEVLWPKIKTRRGGRIISGFIRYIAYLMQIVLSKADLYWVANSPDVVAIPLFILKRKYVYDFRSVWSKEMQAELGRNIWSRLAHLIEILSMKNAKIIVLNSDTLQRDAETFNKPLFLMPNYPLKSFNPTIPRGKFRQMHGANKSSKIVLYVGRLTKVEGTDMFPNIVKTLSKHDTIQLWVVGAGSLQDLIEKLQKEHPKTIKYFGWQPYDNIPNFINASDACIVPRRRDHNTRYYNDKGVQKISEYMLFQKPIVCSGIAPSNEYLLVEEDKLVDGILKALTGNAPTQTPRTWEEDVEPEMIKALKKALANRNPILTFV